MKKLIKFYKRLSFAQGAAFAVSLTSVVGIAANSIPGFFTFTSGQVISSSQVNSNFDKLAQLVEANKSQTFNGTWDATTNIPDIDATSPANGDYYVVVTAGVHNSITYNVGDWAIWNGTAWAKIQNVTGVSSVFGRTGAILKLKGDYVLNDLGDVNISAPTAGQVLQFTGSSWQAGTLPVLNETDPGVMSFAKSALPTCSASEVLKSSGSNFVCVPAFTGSPNLAVVTNASGQLMNSSVTASELNYLTGITSSIQAQLNAKFNTGSFIDWSSPGVQTIDLTRINIMMPDRVAVSNASGSMTYSPTTTAELNYLTGVNSNIQMQLNAKLGTTISAPVSGFDAVNKVYADGLIQYMKTSNMFTGLGYTPNYYSSNSGTNNSFIGAFAGGANTSGANNSFLGYYAGSANTTGSNNTYFGNESGKLMTTGTNNTALGSGTLSAGGVKSFNTAIGTNALMYATTGGSNTVIGAAALGALTTGSNNTVVGKNAGVQLTSSSGNIILGYSAGSGLGTGENNIILGNTAGATNGSNNIIIGNNGANNMVGDNNIVIGGALGSLTSASNSIIFATSNLSAVERMRIDSTGNLGLGTTTPSEKLSVIGNATFSGIVTATSFPTTSDRRLKRNITPIENALEKVLALRGVEFDWIKDGAHEIGLIAQEVEAIVPDLVMTNAKGFKSVKYSNIVSLLIESTKETDEKITALESENKMLKSYLCAKDPGAPFCH
jgi:hypothetical protein